MVTRTISTKYFVCCIALLLLGTLHSAPLYGQVAGATLSGVISDPSGRGITSAKVSIENSTTGVVRTVETDSDGYYTAPNLLPGSYESYRHGERFLHPGAKGNHTNGGRHADSECVDAHRTDERKGRSIRGGADR